LAWSHMPPPPTMCMRRTVRTLTKFGTMTCHRGNEYLWKPEQQLVNYITNAWKIEKATFFYLSIFIYY
jgi:hypothetical protein